MLLGAPTSTLLAPKIAALHRLHAAGLPVPDGVVLEDPHDHDPARWAAVAALLRRGPVIVRTALFDEDREDTAAAGLGTSISDCHDLDSVRRALARIADALADPWLRAHLGPAPRAQVLVQRQISGPWLAVVAVGLVTYAEVHPTASSEPLAAGSTPTLAGPLDLLPVELRGPLAALCDRVRAASPAAPHGLDLELAADVAGDLWVVQTRPLTRPLHPDWPAFRAAAEADLATPLPRALPGLWVLDAEHNPAPLSPAHAGLVRRLAAARPDLVSARVLAGWLYEPAAAGPRPTPSTSAAVALHDLQTVHIPAARAWLTAWDLLLADAAASSLPSLLDRACDHLLDVLATYAALRAAAPTRPAAASPSPMCLRDRQAHLDVLPATWDIASPPLADLPLPVPSDTSPDPSDTSPTRPPLIPPPPDPATPDLSDHDPAALLRELDDHLFALGLAPVRRVYLRAAAVLGLELDVVFLLPPDDLAAALRRGSPPDDLEARRAAHARQADLYPPLQLLTGLPVPAPPRGHLQGLAIGPSATGPLHPRRDLADLLARPLPPGAVLAMPALTAQAAVALHALGVRAVCCEHGGAMSHAAVMARELELSALIGCRGCTALAPGTRVRLDTRTGRLQLA